MTPAAQEQSARQVLRLWQQNLSDMRATDYIEAVWEHTRDAEKAVNVIDAGDWPVPSTQQGPG